jgi:hypothetical protein
LKKKTLNSLKFYKDILTLFANEEKLQERICNSCLSLWQTIKLQIEGFGIVFFPNDLKIDLLIFDLLSKLPYETEKQVL